jgi:hypothetical protein
MHNWYMKLFRRLLNATAPNSMINERQNIGDQIDQLAFWVNSVEELSEQFTDTECKVAGHLAMENIIMLVRERHFLHRVPLFGKKSTPQRRCVKCTKQGRKRDTRSCCLQRDVRLSRRMFGGLSHKTSFLR